MSEVIDIASVADAHVEALAPLVGDDGLDADNGLALLAALPEPARRAIAHVASLLRDAPRAPDMESMVGVARYHSCDAGVLLAAFGWRPPAGHALSGDERLALRLSQQIGYAIGIEAECGSSAAAPLAR